ncbi:MAG: Mrp/NBP35 family ATP-binding protein [Erysipelotrichaceae bacterium]
MTENKPLDPHYDPSKVRPKKGTKIKKMIAIVSGKGGVGKSTIAALLASHSQRAGYQSAIIDGDIIGPSLSHLFNIHEAAGADELGILPYITPSGLKVLSSNMMVETETTPILWRGPLISGAIKQFYTDVLWGELDLMVLDMPPGTGDVALTVFQSLPIDGIIIVTSPQDLVSMIVSKAIEMAQTMSIPILGIIENYSYLICDECGHKMYPFGESKIEDIALKYDLPIIAQLPLDPTYSILADQGKIETIDSEQFTWLVETIMK